MDQQVIWMLAVVVIAAAVAGWYVWRRRRSDQLPPLPVGDQRTLRAPASGELLLGVNDDELQDNRGEYRVSVTIQPR